MDKNTFYKTYAPSDVRIKINIAIGVMIFSAVCSAAVMAMAGNFWVIIDVLIMGGCALFLGLFKSRAAAIVATAYFAIGKIVQIIGGVNTSGLIFGIVFLVLITLSIPATFTLEKEYQRYLAQTSTHPEDSSIASNDNESLPQ